MSMSDVLWSRDEIMQMIPTTEGVGNGKLHQHRRDRDHIDHDPLAEDNLEEDTGGGDASEVVRSTGSRVLS